MKAFTIFALVALSAVPAAADESLLTMLRRPASPALAAVLADEAPALAALDTLEPQADEVRVTREISAEPVSVTTIAITRGREIDFKTYVQRD